MNGLSSSQKLLVVLLLLTAAFLRLYKPLQYPLAINQDELSNIYDGRSIAETGKDRWNTPNPFIVRGLGDGDNRPALQAWIFVGVYKLTGFSIGAARITNALLSLLALWLLFLFLRNSFSIIIAIAGLAVAGLSAWHILFSRMAHEGAVLPFLFIVLVLYLWQKYRALTYANMWGLLLLGFVTGFSSNAYQASKITALVLAVVIAVDVFITTKNKIKPLLFLGIGGLLGAFPQLYTLLQNPDLFFARAKTQSLPLNSLESWGSVLKNTALNLSPDFLFFSSGTHNNLSIYRLYPVEVVFFYAGIILLVINYKKFNSKFPLVLIALTMLAALLPAALTYANPHALRASGLAILAPVCTAIGWMFFTQLIKNEKLSTWVHSLGLATLLTVCLSTAYSYHNSINLRSRNQQHQLVLMYEKLNDYKDKFSTIYIENTTGESYLYLITFCNIAPKEFKQLEKVYYKADFDDFNRLGKYHFVKAENWESVLDTTKTTAPLVVSSSKIADKNPMDSVVFGATTFYFTEAASHSN